MMMALYSYAERESESRCIRIHICVLEYVEVVLRGGEDF